VSPTPTRLVIDPADPALRDDPGPVFSRWRDQQPAWEAPDGAVVVARHGDVDALLRSRAISSAQPGGEAGAPVATLAEHGRWVMIASDPPDHGRRRGAVSPAFGSAAIEALRVTVVDHVDHLLDQLDPTQPIDLVEAFTSRLPVLTLASLLGFDPGDADRVRSWAAAFTDGLEPWADPAAAARAGHALDQMGAHLSALLADRRDHPRPDLLTVLATAPELEPQEALQNALLLINAGLDTSGDLLANTVATLHRHPEQWRTVCADPPSWAAAAIEEVLRTESPVQFAMRRTVGPVTVAHGPVTGGGDHPETVTLAAGRPVLLALGAANRDPEAFDDPERFAIDRYTGARPARRALAFGGGAHLCLGAPLARLEGTVALQRLVERFGSLEVVGPTPWRPRVFFRGVSRLPVVPQPGS
jgi:cytochrome P450